MEILVKIFKKLLALKVIIYYRKKIKKIKSKNLRKNLNKKSKEEIKLFWKKYYKYIGLRWHEYYYFNNGIYSKFYIPEDFYYGILEKKLNKVKLAKAYEDKCMYDRIYPNMNQPKTILRNIEGIYSDKDYIKITEEIAINMLEKLEGVFIIKPSLDTTRAKNVNKIKLTKNKAILKNKEIEIKELLEKYKKDFIIQEVIEQSKVLSEIYPKSLNTLRFSIINLDGEFNVASVILKVGAKGAEVDNLVKGGFAIGIDKKTGKLNTVGRDKNGKVIKDTHPDTGKKFSDLIVPNWAETLETLEKWSEDIPNYFKIYAWDIGLDKNNKPIFIEANLIGQEINFHQLNNGPLFGDKTKEILEKYF